MEKRVTVAGLELNKFKRNFETEKEHRVSTEKSLQDLKKKFEFERSQRVQIQNNLTEKNSSLEKKIAMLTDMLQKEKENYSRELMNGNDLKHALKNNEINIEELKNRVNMFEKITESKDKDIMNLREELNSSTNSLNTHKSMYIQYQSN